MKKIFVFAIFVLAHSFCIAAQQPVSPVAEPGNFGEYRADQNTNNAAIQSNFTELYGSVGTLTSALNGKASISCFANSTAAAACGIDLDWLGTGVGDDLGSATAANVSSLFSGTGDCLRSDGTKGDCGGVSSWADVSALLTGTGDYVKADGSRGTPSGTMPTCTNAQDMLEWDSTSSTWVCVTPMEITAGTNITITSGVIDVKANTYQPLDADLTTWAGVSPGTGVATAIAAPVDGTGGLASKSYVDTHSGSGWGVFAELSSAPYSDTSCTSSGVYSHVVYFCVDGYFTEQAVTTAYSNPSPDLAPDAFTFADVTDAELLTQYTALVQITGITGSITCTGTDGTVAACTGSTEGTCGTFGATSWSIANNQYVGIRQTSSASNSTATNATATCGGVSDTFSVTTKDAVAAEFCDGTEIFCTSWETGSDALNTGATGNEDVFSSSTGTFALSTTLPKEGSKCIYGQSNSYVETTNGGAGFGSSVTVSGYVRFDDENSGSGYILNVYDTANYNVLYIRRETDGNTNDNVIPVSVRGKFTNTTDTQLGSNFNVNEDEWYSYTMRYNTSTDVANVVIKDSSNAEIFSQSTSLTLTMTIDSIRVHAQGSGYVSHDGIKVNP